MFPTITSFLEDVYLDKTATEMNIFNKINHKLTLQATWLYNGHGCDFYECGS